MQNDHQFPLNDGLSKPLTNSNHSLTDKNKIYPIPIIRKSIPNSPKLRIKLRANGYKNFSKLAAAGPYTFQTLQNIDKSSSLKFVQKFEFDPYLCNDSYFTELKIALKKLKTVKQIYLTIRRLNQNINEVNNLKSIGSALSKLQRLRKIRVEFPSISNLEEPHTLAIYNSLRKCYLLKSLEWIVVESPHMSAQYFQVFMRLMTSLRKLEHYKDYMTIKKGIPSCTEEDLQQYNDSPKVPHLKHLEMMYSVTKEWSHMGEDGDLGYEMFKQYLHSHTGLQSFKLQLIKTACNSQDLLNIMPCFTSLVHLKRLDFEFLNCGIGDIEVAMFVYGLSLIPQLKYVRLKVIQSDSCNISRQLIFSKGFTNFTGLY